MNRGSLFFLPLPFLFAVVYLWSVDRGPGVMNRAAVSHQSMEYAYVYNQKSIEPLQVNDAIVFDSNGPMSPGITHAQNSAEIVLSRGGHYQVNGVLYTTGEGSTFAFFLNGQRVNGTTYGTLNGHNMNMQAIIAINAGDSLTIRATESSRYAVGSIGEGKFVARLYNSRYEPSINASVVIRQLSSL